MRTEKKLTLDDIEEFNRRISEASSRSGSCVSENEESGGDSSRKNLREHVFEDALKMAILYWYLNHQWFGLFKKILPRGNVDVEQ